MTASIVYMTAESPEQARAIAEKLIEERLAACVNLFPGMESIYHWKGKVERDSESAFIAKTKPELVDSLIKRVRQLHSYETPCIVEIPIDRGDPDFLKWIHEQTRKTGEM